MTAILLIKNGENLKGVWEEITRIMGIIDYAIGESSNVLHTSYFEAKAFGVKVKLEENSYEFEDKYSFMLSIQKDFLTNFILSESTMDKLIGDLVKALKVNSEQPLAIERNMAWEFHDLDS